MSPQDRHTTYSNFVIAKRLRSEAEAAVYAARLREVGIDSFVSNSHAGTLIPFVNGGFLLHVREEDLERAGEIMSELDQLAQVRVDGDFRDADHGDIAFEKAITDHESWVRSDKNNLIAVGFVLLVIAALILAQWLRTR